MFRRLFAPTILLGVLAAAPSLSHAAAPPSYPEPPYVFPTHQARLVGVFRMSGTITTAVNVRGERKGQKITRKWTFTGSSCGETVCARLALKRERSAKRFSSLVLKLRGGMYSGGGSFDAPLRCLGKTYRRGETVPYRVTVRITSAVLFDGIPFAYGITATYTNTKRIDHARCPLGPSHDAARYTGVLRGPVVPAA
ncbi:MAG: hypothetical protein ACYDHH_08605 [Solirubrobacteraceae bacterium]